MKHLKILGLAALSAMASMSIAGATTASATTLEVGGVTKNESISITASLKAGTSIFTKDTFGFSTTTCTEGHGAGSTSKFSGTRVTGETSEFTYGGCNHPTSIHNPGQIYIEWTSGTNGRVYLENGEATAYSTIHGTYVRCTSGEGTAIGTLTGTASGHAELHINATINCSPHLSSARWTGTLIVTSPTGLGVSS